MQHGLNTHICAQGFNVLASLSNHSPCILKTQNYTVKMSSILKKWKRKVHVRLYSLCSGEAPWVPPFHLRCGSVWMPVPHPCPQQGACLREHKSGTWASTTIKTFLFIKLLVLRKYHSGIQNITRHKWMKFSKNLRTYLKQV